MNKNVNLSEYNESELELFRVFYEVYGERKLLLGSTRRLIDGFDKYIEEKENGNEKETT
ncbi:hypothetical protein OAJ85_00460 [Pseudomonadota bacterium]|jgi:FKBP-type peptidyl-prolyl cis-trans isomerase 2|nr:hypothetical protein [Pseudomonadota bacterium]